MGQRTDFVCVCVCVLNGKILSGVDEEGNDSVSSQKLRMASSPAGRERGSAFQLEGPACAKALRMLSCR